MVSGRSTPHVSKMLGALAIVLSLSNYAGSPKKKHPCHLEQLSAASHTPAWEKEISDLGYKGSRSDWMIDEQLAYSAEYPLENEVSQFKAVDSDMRAFVRAKAKATPEEKKLVIFEAGIGFYASETRDLVKLALSALEAENKKDWKIEVFAVDLDSESLSRAREYLAEDFPASAYPNVSVKFAQASIVDPQSLERARAELGISATTVDYIWQRNVSRPNFALFRERAKHERERLQVTSPLAPVVGKATDHQKAVLRDSLGIYLPYRYLFEQLGRDSRTGLGTRMVVEDTTVHFSDKQLPTDVPDFVPPGTERIGPRGTGIIELKDLTAVQSSTLSSFQKALRQTSEKPK